MDKNFIQRAISGIFYALTIFICTHPLGSEMLNKISPFTIHQSYLFYGLMTLFFIVGLKECVSIMKFDNGYQKWVVFPLALLVYYFFSKRYFYHDFSYHFRYSEVLALSLILIACITLFRFKEELDYDSGKLIFAVIYLALPFGFALGLPQYSNTYQGFFTKEVFFLFILIWSSDTFAYLSGKFLGKHKMAPKISPKKTWEGFAGGVILTLVLSYFLEQNFQELRGNWIIVGLLVASFAPLGDLVESQLKRSFGVKDSGNIIPGHGGVLDRLDSFIIVAPVVYLYFILETLT
ncbi:MAG: phosphatidate cytidylyltransferase [Flavobacteriales bacterium]|nr:MAG: phosphatidate cytidylyltransferase [Flavobacteriales bacterium]